MRMMPLPARRDETPPPKLVVLSGTSHDVDVPPNRVSKPWEQRIARGRKNLGRQSAQIWVLLVAAVVIPHALRIADHGSVVTRDLKRLGKSMRPLR